VPATYGVLTGAQTAAIRGRAVLDPLGWRTERVLQITGGLAALLAAMAALAVAGPVVAASVLAVIAVPVVVRSTMAPVGGLVGMPIVAAMVAPQPGVRHGFVPGVPGLDGQPVGWDDQAIVTLAMAGAVLGALAVLRRQREVGAITVGRGLALLAGGAGFGVLLPCTTVAGPDGYPLPWWLVLLVVGAAFGPFDLSRGWRAAAATGAVAVGGLVAVLGRLGPGELPAWSTAAGLAAVALVLLAVSCTAYALMTRRLRGGAD